MNSDRAGMPYLLPCPIPWGEAELINPEGCWNAVRCKKCGLSTGNRNQDYKATDQWNDRADLAQTNSPEPKGLPPSPVKSGDVPIRKDGISAAQADTFSMPEIPTPCPKCFGRGLYFKTGDFANSECDQCGGTGTVMAKPMTITELNQAYAAVRDSVLLFDNGWTDYESCKAWLDKHAAIIKLARERR